MCHTATGKISLLAWYSLPTQPGIRPDILGMIGIFSSVFLRGDLNGGVVWAGVYFISHDAKRFLPRDYIALIPRAQPTSRRASQYTLLTLRQQPENPVNPNGLVCAHIFQMKRVFATDLKDKNFSNQISVSFFSLFSIINSSV